MAKYYFEEKDSERCYDLETIKDRMRCENLTERKVFEAEREIDAPAFFCRFDAEVYEKGSCRDCTEYTPRNKVSGICKHNRPVYNPSKWITIKL